MSVPHTNTTADGSSGDSQSKAHPEASAVLVNYITPTQRTTGHEYDPLMLFDVSDPETGRMSLEDLMNKMWRANRDIAETLTTTIVQDGPKLTGEGHPTFSMNEYIGSRPRGSDYVFDSNSSVAHHVSGRKTDVWAAPGKGVISVKMTSATDLSCFDDPDWTVQPVIGTIRRNWSGKHDPHLGVRSKADDRARDILASQKWRDVVLTVGDADDMPTLGHATKTLKKLDSAVAKIQSDLEAKDRSSCVDTLKTFATGVVAGGTIAALASSAFSAAKAWSQ